MSEIFLRLVNQSLAAGWLVLCVLLLRRLLVKAPKSLRPFLWGLVGLRLLLPFSLESALSLLPSAEPLRPELLYSEVPALQSGIPALNQWAAPVLSGSASPVAAAPPLQSWISLAALVWLGGLALLLGYGVVSGLRLRWRVRTAVPWPDQRNQRQRIRLSEQVTSPFVLGLFRPRIYLPFQLPPQTLEQVLAHEQAHIRRCDHLIKPLAYVLLCLYWFNPLLWLAYILLCRDVELACDERVIRSWGPRERADYSQALLNCSIPQRLIAACPLAFGEVGVRERVKSVLSYKKPAFWLLAVAVLAALVTGVCFLTAPPTPATLGWAQSLDVQDVAGIELVVTPQAEARAYKRLTADEIPAVVDLLRASRGQQVDAPVQPSASSICFYITMADGSRHQVGAVDDRYLYIDGDHYAAGAAWLTTWRPYAEAGNAPLPTGFFSQPLTLEALLALCQRGDELSWADFDGYTYTEAGSGIHIRVYEIDEQFSLWLGDIATEDAPFYARLQDNYDDSAYIDIRHEDVAAFIAERQAAAAVGNDTLETAVSAAILRQHSADRGEGLLPCESHVTLATLVSGQTVVVYALVLYEEFAVIDSACQSFSGSHGPVALTFTVDADGAYTLTEYWQPRDGNYYAPDVREKFPAAAAEEALNTQKYILRQEQNCYAQAVAASQLDTEPLLTRLLDEIVSAPITSSAPYDDSAALAYRELTYYGDHTLKYCFAQFLQGDQTGLRGQIMSRLLDDLIGGEALKLAADSGQEYFDAWREYNEDIYAQHGAAYMQEHCPKGWLLLQLLNE